jgi:hypothetical protein
LHPQLHSLPRSLLRSSAALKLVIALMFLHSLKRLACAACNDRTGCINYLGALSRAMLSGQACISLADLRCRSCARGCILYRGCAATAASDGLYPLSQLALPRLMLQTGWRPCAAGPGYIPPLKLLSSRQPRSPHRVPACARPGARHLAAALATAALFTLSASFRQKLFCEAPCREVNQQRSVAPAPPAPSSHLLLRCRSARPVIHRFQNHKWKGRDRVTVKRQTSC